MLGVPGTGEGTGLLGTGSSMGRGTGGGSTTGGVGVEGGSGEKLGCWNMRALFMARGFCS